MKIQITLEDKRNGKSETGEMTLNIQSFKNTDEFYFSYPLNRSDAIEMKLDSKGRLLALRIPKRTYEL